jgi:hypothetical protein
MHNRRWKGKLAQNIHAKYNCWHTCLVVGHRMNSIDDGFSTQTKNAMITREAVGRISARLAADEITENSLYSRTANVRNAR